MSQLSDALKEFESTEANLDKLDKLWKKMEPLLPSHGSGTGGPSDEDVYKDIERKFENIRMIMPKIDGFELANKIHPCDSMLPAMLDYAELGEPFEELAYLKSLREQGNILKEYRFRLGVKRRQLVRGPAESVCDDISKILDGLAAVAAKLSPGDKMPEPEWTKLGEMLTSLRTLLPLHDGLQRWDMLIRHLSFGMRGDYDIVKRDWPVFRSGLQNVLYGGDEPLPVTTTDIGLLVASKPEGRVVSKLQWSNLSPDAFERLIFNIIGNTEGYEKPEWLIHVNAPDGGRDLSAFRIKTDRLVAPRRERVIVQCKHKKSVGIKEISTLCDQMRLWEPPRVDELIIASTGRFTKDLVTWTEKHNQSRETLKIELWAESHLARLLSERPNLVAEFRLR